MTVLSEYSSKTSKKIEDMDGEADDQEPNFSDPEGYQDSASDEGLIEIGNFLLMYMRKFLKFRIGR